ncbi:acetyl-CoA decarbonylase/synthase complex subunit delta [Desulfomonile tiedjei]|uniref:CO dehydrogenase/acetyl-CoA synthase delta subunit (Corrinoid Fe-S protein) n=1 Tax=Desulfomonile tiedjei (strain ATCC 49306 / DSM 6799 / DCB-1) TaxID=706587 RepID=I4CDX6_DESTA|nr:acetyl-CoA decarbonylase/synthase complex subunit delta [Desulfomonile tiedjei]AFM27767.1 CO dehydrogenase/acetyl-CoA synthase delta subunit (corrinoid Fe-S protein) [Desulfomonile tiedjei DSM 6799]
MGALPQVKYSGKIREISMGKPGCEVTVGGETAYNFYGFEGLMPHAPKLALQVVDIQPEEWAPDALEPYVDVLGDPVAWAKKCVEYGADMICLWLAGTDPNGKNLPAEHAAEIARQVAEAINVPLIVWGVSSDEKNTAVLKAVAESCAGFNLVLGPVTESNFKQVGAAAIAYKHIVAANSPIDINLAKQLNILLENLGVPTDRILIDPTTGSVGYGMEYCYSIMERIRQAALTQNDDKLQYPIINNIAEEVWKTKEAKLSENDDPRLGNAGIRGINLEAITALSALQAGSDLLILRHPETMRHIRNYVDNIMVKTDLDSMGVDLSLVTTHEAPPLESKATERAAATPKPSVSEIPQSKQPKPFAQEPTGEQEAGKDQLLPSGPASMEQPPEAVKQDEPLVIHSKKGTRKAKPASDSEEDLGLSEEDIEALKEMSAAFRAFKGLVLGLARLLSK